MNKTIEVQPEVKQVLPKKIYRPSLTEERVADMLRIDPPSTLPLYQGQELSVKTPQLIIDIPDNFN